MATDIQTPIGRAPVIPVMLIGIGAYLAWFGVHYWDSDTKYPTDPVKAVLQGKPLPQPTGQTSAQDIAAQVQGGSGAGEVTGTGQAPGTTTAGGRGGATNTAPVTGTAAANQTLGKLLAAAYGWAPTQSPADWDALVKLWNQESGWSNTVRNSQSGAYGIAQALGHGTGSTAGAVTNEYGNYGLGDAVNRAANSGDPASQIRWGLQYIKVTYGSPSAAWAHEVANNWY